MIRDSVWPYVWMLVGSMAFALMGTFAHALGAYCDWQLIALARALLALVLTAALALASGARLVFWKPGTLWIRSVAGSVAMVCTFYAYTRLPLSNVLILTNMFPIWVAVLSGPLLHETPPGYVWLSVVSGIVGVFLIGHPESTDGGLATYIVAGSSFFTAIAMIGLHRLKGVDARAVVVHFSGVAVVFCVVSLVLFDRRTEVANLLHGRPLLLLMGLGLTATAGQLLLTKAFASGQPAQVSVVGLTQVAFALMLDLLIWGYTFEPQTLVGMSLVVAPTAWLMIHRA